MQKNRKILNRLILPILGLALAGIPIAIEAQQGSPSEAMKQVVSRLETNVDRFEDTLFSELNRSGMDGSQLEDELSAHMTDLARSTDDLGNRMDYGPIKADVVDVLGDALRIENRLRGSSLSPNVLTSWAQVKTDLDSLAKSQNILWVWSVKNYPPLTEDTRRRTISRLEMRADEFRESFDDALDRSRVDGKPYEDHVAAVVGTFERALDDLDARAGRRERVDERNVMIVLNNAQAIDGYMQKYRMTPRARLDWARVRAELDDLARIYNVAWVWTVRPGRSTVTAVDAEKPEQ